MLHFKEIGEKKNETILFVHGLGGNLKQMGKQESLADAFHLVFVDLQGFGQSPIEKGLSFPDQAQAIFEVMDFLKVKTFHTVGVSMGGVIAQEMSTQQPERIRSLVLSNTFAYISDEIRPFFGQRTIQDVLANNTKGTVARFLYDKENREHLLQIKRGNTLNKEAYVTSARNCLAADYRKHLATLSVQTLVVTGQYDEAMPLRHSEEIHHLIPRSTYIVIENCGHLPNIEKAETFNALIREFITQKE